jgi:uncharacterized membrane protein
MCRSQAPTRLRSPQWHPQAPRPPARAEQFLPDKSCRKTGRVPTSSPPGSGLLDGLGARLQALLFGGNLPVKLGILVLFAGVAAALRYAAQQGYFEFPIGLRLIGLAALAVVALGFGLAQRHQRPSFGLAVQGGALGILLLTTFAAFRLYSLLPPGTALGLVVLLVAIAALLAVWQDAVALAVLGFLGGYLAPVLISTGSGDHIALFSYYAALNAAMFAVAWWRHWYPLNLIGFLFTFGVGTLWGVRDYEAADYSGVQAFLILFWAFYLGIVVLGALRRGAAASRGVEVSLSFGLPLWAFSLQASLLEGDRPGLTVAALLAAAVYAGLAVLMLRLHRTRLQGESFAWIAVGFATLAVPLAFSASQTAAIWAIQGAGALWLGLRQRRMSTQFAGWALQGIAAVAFAVSALDQWQFWDREAGPELIGLRLSLVLLALSGFVGSFVYERLAPSRHTVWPLFVLGSSWLGVLWLSFGSSPPLQLDWIGALIAASAMFAAVAALLRGPLRWPRLSWQIVLQLGLAPLLALVAMADSEAPLLEGRSFWVWAAWALLAALGLRALREPEAKLTGLAHLSVLAVVVAVLGVDFGARAQRAELGDAWILSLGVLPAIALCLGLWRARTLATWPLAEHFPRYSGVLHLLLGLALGFAWLIALVLPAGPQPMAYLPLFNPLELLQWLALFAAYRMIPGEHADLQPMRVVLALAALTLASLTVLRCVHHFSGLDWSPDLFDSAVTQGALSVLWALAGVTAWVYGSRRERWTIWLGGAVLMGVVLLKLVMIDRAYLGNIAGIAAVLTVGLLLVAVGYLAPSPPRRGAADTA